MKTIVTLMMCCCLWISLFAQAPQKMSYQAVIRNAGGSLITNHAVGMKISILQGSPNGTVVFQELFNPNPQTNSNGLVSIEIGTGIPVTGTFSGINWSTGPSYLKTETDPLGGTNYTISGISQLLSVPYALYAKDVQNGSKPGGASGNVQFNNIGALGGDENFSWDNTNKRLGIGITYPTAKLHVNNWNNTRQIALNDWSDISASTAGYGLFASNAYLSNDLNTLHFSNSHASLGASGIIFNYPSWHTATIFVNESAGGSVKGQPFSPNAVASFSHREVNVHNNKITNVANPVNARDAATKAYVDVFIDQLYEQGVLKVKDIDGNFYIVVKIGSQFWMAENLKTTKFNDGSAIPLVTDNKAWVDLTTPGYCWFNNDKETYGIIHGAIYNWYAASTGKLCPLGWHVPSDAEWTTLATFLGGESVAGGKMKETGIAHWESPNTGATNESGFTALGDGCRGDYGYFGCIGTNGTKWSSTEAWYRSMYYTHTRLDRYHTFKQLGVAVRCLKDERTE